MSLMYSRLIAMHVGTPFKHTGKVLWQSPVGLMGPPGRETGLADAVKRGVH